MVGKEFEVIELNERPFGDVTVIDIMKGLDANVRAWLIGGAARSLHTGERIADYDIVFGDKNSLDLFTSHIRSRGAVLMAETLSHSGKHMGADYMLGSSKIQLKFPKFYANAAEQLDTADFTVCQFFYALGNVRDDEFRFGCSTLGLIDSKMKILRLHKLSQPATTVARLYKFINRGYNPTSNIEFYKPLVEEIRALPYDEDSFEPIRKRRLVRVR